MKLDQCLFGYDDGHRLLASSLSLESETSLLTELSDLAPGTIFGHSEGYWTGIPVPAIRRYAFMRTWSAPEMSRPGCVWTHALLIEPALLESVEDLSVLQNLVVRPTSPVDTARYREPLPVDIARLGETPAPIDDAIVRRLISALYGEGDSSVEVASPGELDGPLFAVWSQQWPRLRRNLRFQTAASQMPRSPGAARFDITAVLGQRHNATTRKHDESDTAWSSVAALDVQNGAKGALHRFLWLYGQNVRRQRSSFRPLVEIYSMNRNPQSNSAQNLINIVLSAFPSVDDAGQLKQDLVDGVLVASAQAELLHFVLSNQKDAVFPPPSNAGIAKLKNLWPEQPNQILQLAEITAEALDSLGRSVFETITARIEASDFWPLTRAYPRVRKHILQARPELLVADAELELDDEALIELLPLVPLETQGLAGLILRLLPRDNEKLAMVAFERFPSMTAAQVILATDDVSAKVAGAWKKELTRRPRVLLKSDIMVLASRASLLFKLADSLGWLTPEVIAAGSGPWVAALKKASNDLWGDQEDTFNSFLIALALESGGSDGREAIELLFDTVHGTLLKSRLYGHAREILLPRMPELGWISTRDLGLRFRMAVAAAYVRYRWPAQSYAALTTDRKVRAMLADAASDTPGGKPYCDAATW